MTQIKDQLPPQHDPDLTVHLYLATGGNLTEKERDDPAMVEAERLRATVLSYAMGGVVTPLEVEHGSDSEAVA